MTIRSITLFIAGAVLAVGIGCKELPDSQYKRHRGERQDRFDLLREIGGCECVGHPGEEVLLRSEEGRLLRAGSEGMPGRRPVPRRKRK
mgnify:CR=1 FL=1